MAYADIFNAATDSMFQGRCQVAAWIAAQNIISEDPQTPDHPARINWAINILRDTASITPKQLAMQVLRNATIAGNPGASSDGDIQFQVNSLVADLVVIG
jgi:hypothetical protein